MNNPFERLKDIKFSEPEKLFLQKEKISKKPLDILVRSILESNPELREKIIGVMQKLMLSSDALPLVHVTADRIISPDGSERDPNMVEQIETGGFKGRHTNVGAFVVRRGSTKLAEPQDYEKDQEDFLKSLVVLLRRYWHHGSRTNKDVYAERRDEGKGIPIMLVLQGNLSLEHGTDYDDHFILKEDVSPDVIWGKVKLETESGIDNQMVSRVANDLLEIIDSYEARKFEARLTES